MIWAMGAAAVLGGAMPWRRRILEWMRGLIEWEGRDSNIVIFPTQTLATVGGLALTGMCAYFVLGGHSGTTTVSGGEGQGGDEGVTTPIIDVAVVDTTTWWVIFNAYASTSEGDTQDSIQIQVDRAGGNFSSPLTNAVSQTTNLRDTITDNADWKADSTYVVRGRRFSTILDVWSAYDSITVVNNPGPVIASLVTAIGQDPDTTWYESVRVDTLPAGASYVDSIAGLTICKVTDNDRNSPAAGSYVLPYSNGGQFVSRTWIDGVRTFSVSVYNSVANTAHIIQVGKPCTITGARAGPAGVVDTRFSFSNVAGTPRTAYFTRGDTLHQYDTAGDSVVFAGDFPIAGFSDDGWFHQDANDTVFVSLTAGGDSAKVFFRKDSTIVRRTVTGFNEPYMNMNGVKVLLQVGGIETDTKYIWNPRAATVDTVVGSLYSAIYHSANLFDRWPSANVGSGAGHNPHYSLDASAKSVSQHRDDTVGYCGSYHMGGGWKQPNVAEGSQYYSVVWHTRSEAGFNNCAGGYGHTLWNLDGTVPKWIAHHYNDVDGNNTYWEESYGQQSVDGFAYCFSSDQNDRGVDPGTDIFCAWLPGA